MIEALLAGIFGLLIGSFLNVCIYRLPRDLSVVRPRSHCPSCEKTIAWYDNIPVLSFLLLHAKCRHCPARISYRYPLVELMTGAAFFLAVLFYGLSLPALKLCVLSAILIELAFSDLEERILPDEFTIGGIVAGVAFALFLPMEPGLVYTLMSPVTQPAVVSVAESLAGAIFTSGTLWLVGWLYLKIRKREGLGFGDVKMIAMIGAFMGIHLTLVVLIIGSVLGSVVGLLFIFLARKDSTYELPYGTFLAIAALLYGFLGRVILPF
jgi:leader peptidase (prepilin peptidase)/N-methyltransferase